MSFRKQLVVNADDFGFTPDVNQGIVEAHRRGILTAATLMANGDAWEHSDSTGWELMMHGATEVDAGFRGISDVVFPAQGGGVHAPPDHGAARRPGGNRGL